MNHEGTKSAKEEGKKRRGNLALGLLFFVSHAEAQRHGERI
jgi:hypothetical protein